ncbi:hypothetical protein ACFRR7_15405 [Streptomyces sp. NPDC056909]|uniref:hypothetical protein n=1 Tax=Streptomyces sp. NPDC056909 TaxID=3345963 RepID=UPI0036A42C02
MARVALALRGLAVALAAVAGTGVAVTGAAAAERVHVQPKDEAGAGTPAPDNPVLRGQFFKLAECLEAGRRGVDGGQWSWYQCASGGFKWYLWTDR